MKLLVTGGAGYIGSHTVAKLLEQGHDVVVYDNLSTGFVEALPTKCNFVHGDVRNRAALSEAMRQYETEGVVHFAAKLIVPESVKYPYTYYENNVLGSLCMLQACWENDINKVVFSSTAAVYGNAPKSAIVDENETTEPLNSYAHSKLSVEKILEDGRRAHGLNYVALRYFNVAGAAVNGTNGLRSKNASHIIKVLAEAAVGKRKEVHVFGTDYPTPDGTCIRDYIHVEDLADLHVLSLNHLQNGGCSEIMNCGYGFGNSVLQVVDSMKRVSGKDFRIVVTDRRPGDATCLVANSNKIQKLFKWSPKRADLDLICKTAFEWEVTMQRAQNSSFNIGKTGLDTGLQ